MTWTPIEGSFLGGTSCCICETYVVSIEAEADRALCIECGRDRNAVDWTWFEPLGAWHPTVGYAAPGAGERTESRFHRDPVPVADVTSRDPWPSGVQASAPVVKLVNLAKEHGWDAWMGYSRCGAEELISVRVKRSGIAGHAIYRTASGKSWAWQSFKIIPEGTWPRPCFLLAEFQAVLREAGSTPVAVLLSWLAKTAERKAETEALAKRRTAWRTEVRRRYTPGVLVLDAATVEQGEALGYDWVDVIKIIMTAKPGKKEGSR